MSLDASLRGELRKAVQASREILTSDLSEVLEGTYGIHRNGLFEPIDHLPELEKDDFRETRDLLETMLPPTPKSLAARKSFEDQLDHLLRSLAFTHLNRLIAFKLMEHKSRGLIKESLGRTTRSRGFLLWAAKDPEQERLYSTGREDEAYVNYLHFLCSELDQKIGILFDTNDLASRVQGARAGQPGGPGRGLGRGGNARLGLPVLHAQGAARHRAQAEPGSAQPVRDVVPQPVLHTGLCGALSR